MLLFLTSNVKICFEIIALKIRVFLNIKEPMFFLFGLCREMTHARKVLFYGNTCWQYIKGNNFFYSLLHTGCYEHVLGVSPESKVSSTRNPNQETHLHEIISCTDTISFGSCNSNPHLRTIFLANPLLKKECIPQPLVLYTPQ